MRRSTHARQADHCSMPSHRIAVPIPKANPKTDPQRAHRPGAPPNVRSKTMSDSPEVRPPLPPFTRESAIQKVRAAEDGWNTRDPQRVSLAYTPQSVWRNRAEFVTGREAIVELLARKWARELDYRLIKELWAYADNRIAVRFAYEWHDDSG